MKFFHKKFTKQILVLLAVFVISFGKDISLAQSVENNIQIETSNPILDNSLYKIENLDFLVELGDKENNNDDLVSFKAFPKKEIADGLFGRLSNWATVRQKGISFELIKTTDQSMVESEIAALDQEFIQENDQSGVAAQVGGFFNGLIDQFWKNVDDLANIGRKTDDLIWEENDNTTTVVNPILDKDISLEYQALENGLKENIIINGSEGEVFDSYLYKLNLDPGVILHRVQSDSPFGLPQGTYYFTDENNNYIAHFLPMVALDANGLETKNIEMEITPVGTGRDLSLQNGSPLQYAIVITVDKNWLTDTAIQYPIKIDPSIVHDTKAEFDAGILNRLQSTSADRVELKHHELSHDESTVGLWHMNESSGQSIYDYGGVANNTGQLGSTTGSDTNDPTWNTTSQKLGASALSFDGVNDFVTIPDSSTWYFAKNNFTISAWFKTTGGDNEKIYYQGDSGGTPSTISSFIQISSGGIVQFVPDYATYPSQHTLSSNRTVNDGTWHNVTVVRNGIIFDMYIDGQKENSLTLDYSMIDSSYPLTIGAMYNGVYNPFNGSIDEVRISNRALSPEEIKADAQYSPYGVYTSSVMDLGTSEPTWQNFSWTESGVRTSQVENDIDTTNLVAQWNFNETNGTTAVSSGSCGTSCNGTLNNFANTSAQDATPMSGWTYENRLKYGADGDGSLMFDGVDDYIDAGNNLALQITGNITIEAWIYPTQLNDTNYYIIGAKQGPSGYYGYQLYIGNGTKPYALFGLSSNGTDWNASMQGSQVLQSGKWYYIVGSYDGSNIRTYINGVLDSTRPYTGSIYNTNTNFTIGKSLQGTNANFNGILESPKIYSRALSADEINSNYQAGNIEFQTRTGTDTTPEDGGWEEWKSTGTAAEMSVQNFNSTLNTIDPDPYTTLLLHGEGINGSQTFVDSAISPASSFEVVGNAQNSTAQKKFGSSSLYFDGFADELDVHSNANIVHFGSGDFTIDTWVRFSSWATGYRRNFFVDWQDGSNNIFLIQQEDNKLNFSFFGGGVYTNITSTTTWVPNSNQWYHVALTRNGSSWRYFIDGTQLGSTITNSLAIDNCNGYIALGNRNLNDSHLETYIDELRVSKGIARWTANFTPPKYAYNTGINQISNKIDTTVKTEGTGSERCLIGQTQPDVNTVGLWHMEETSGTGAYIKDSSGNGNHGTPTNTTPVDSVSGQGRNFSGSNGDNISIPGMTWTPTTFTVDWWLYPESCTNYNQQIRSVSGWGGFLFHTDSNCAVYVGTDVNYRFTPTELSTNTLSLNQWQHFAYVYDGSKGYFYKNGQLLAGPKVQNTSTAWNGFYIGDPSNTIDGTIDEVRISNVARTPEEIAEAYRMGANYHITRSLSSNIDLATTNNKLPIQIASDRPGTSLMLTLGESAYANNELDTNTLGYWSMEENFSGGTNAMRECTDADPIGTACGGGKKFATGLVAMPAGCANSLNEPSCTSPDTLVNNKTWDNPLQGIGENAYSTTDGLSNTNNLYNSNPPANPAGDYCHDLIKSGYSDWYLPAQSELQSLYNQRTTIGGFMATQYWSSTEYNEASHQYAYYVSFLNGSSSFAGKNAGYEYRCIRQYNGEQQKIKDSSPLNLSGQAVGTSPTQGKFGKGRYFNGTSDYIRTEDPNSILEGNTFTIEAWVNPSSLTGGTNSHRIAGKIGNDTSNCGYGYNINLDDTDYFKITTDPTGCGNTQSVMGKTKPVPGQWYYVVGTYNGTVSKIYVNGVLENSASVSTINDFPSYFLIGAQLQEQTTTYVDFFEGAIDEVRYSNIVRTPNEIRQAYEAGLRSHPITIDFGAQLDSGNLITGSGDLSFTVDATKKGLPTKGENLFVGDKVIIKENYNGTEYLAQGTVTSVNKSTGAVTVAAWDSGSTFSSSGQTGFSANADVFKWQKEIASIYGSLAGHRDELNKISLRILDGNQGQNIWLDDMKVSTPLMTNPTTNTIQSTPNRYFQYRFFAHTTDTDPTPGVDDVELDYSTIEMTGASTSESYINTNNNTAFNIQCNGVTDSGTGDNVTCEASFNQTNWYSVGSATTPLSNQTVQGTPDISSWTGYPSGDGSVTIYARAHNTTNDTYSDIYNFSVNKDVSRPTVTSITSVAGDTTSLYSDGTDDSSTLVVYATSADATSCRWSATDQTYTAMTNTCTSTTNCTLNLGGKGQKDVYIGCIDAATNYSQPNYHLTYYIDVDPDIVALDAGPSSSDRTSLTSDQWFNYSQTGSDDQISFSWTDPNSPSDDYFYYLENDSSVNAISNTNLVGWWNFEDDTITSALDHSGQANHATLYGTSTTSGNLGLSRSFNGTSDYVHDNALAASIPGNLTVTGWIKASTIPSYQERIIDLAQAGDAGLQVCIDTSGNILLENSGGPSGVVYGGNATDNNWHHFAVTRSGTTYEFFVDGVSKGTTSGSAPTYTQMYFGRRQTGGDFYNGQIDDTKIFTRVLSSTEIGNEYRIRLTQNNYLDSQTVTEGTFFKHVRPINGVDSWGNELQFITKYDKTNPTLSASGNSEQWYSSNPTITLTTVDNHSGLNYSKYSWDSDDTTCRSSGTNFSNSDNINIPTNGTHVLYLCNQDIVNNQNSWNGIYKLDNTTPDLISIDAGQSSADRTSLTSHTWFGYADTGSDDQVSFSWTDPASPSDDYFYYLENDFSIVAFNESNLAAWWSFENDNTTTAWDHSSNNNDGTFDGSASSTGQLGSSRYFDGSDDKIQITDHNTLKPATNLTVSAWFRTQDKSIASQQIISKTRHSGYSLSLSNTQLCFAVSDGYNSYKYACISNAAINNDTWYHVAGTYDGSNVKLYLDGQFQTQTVMTTNIYYMDSVLCIGAEAGTLGNICENYYFKGDIDEAKIYTRTLTDTEINNEYSRRLTTSPYLDNQLVTEGTYYKHIRPFSGADTWGSEQQFIEKYDKTAPTIDSITSIAGDTTLPYFDTTDDSNTLVVYTSSDNLNIVDQCKWSTSDEIYSVMPNVCSNSTNCNLNLAGDGAKTVYIRCRDNIGNEASSSYVLNYTIDSTPPAVLSITSVTGDTTAPYKDNTDNANTGVIYTASADAVACRWSQTDQNYESMTDTCSDTSNCTLNLTGEGAHSVFMRCIDVAGLSSTTSYALDYSIDATPPTINSITSVAGDTAATYYDTTDDSATQILFDVTADTNECKWSTSDQSYDSMPNTCSTPGNCTANLAGQGAKTVYLRCKDDVDNKMTTSTQVDYVIDSIAPGVLSITSVANDFIAPYLDTTIPYGQAPVVYVASADATTCRWSVNNVEYDSMTNTCTSTSNCTITHSGDGGKSIFFRCTDEAGNKSPNSYQLDFEVDENIDGGGIRAEETSSQPNDPTNFFITFTPKLVTPAAVNGSIRIRLESEYDLSALTHDDVFAAGGDVIWTDDELIYPDNNIIVFPFTGDLSNDDGQLSLTIANLQTINPGSTGSFFVSYDIFDNPAGTGTSLESGDGLVHLNYIVIVTASVPSFLEATINPVGVGENINGNITNIATNNGQVVDFGTFAGADDRIAAHDIAISTNANSGYQVSIEYDHSLAAGTNFVPDFVGTNANPLNWQTPPGSGIEAYFGYTTEDNSLWGTPTNRFAGGKWSGFTTEPQEVIYENHTVDNQTTRIGYRLQISGQQGVGFYNSNISYIITSTY